MQKLVGLKAIASELEKFWCVPISIFQVVRYSKLSKDPLPVISIRVPGKSSGRCFAHADEVRRWAVQIAPTLCRSL